VADARSVALPGGVLLTRVARRSVVEDVRGQIVALIRSGRLRVHDQLPSEIELAQSFGVSRPVVREALVGLQALGLTSSRNGRGTFVAADRRTAQLLLGGYRAEHLNEVRRCLEIPVSRLAAQRRTRADLTRLNRLLECLAGEERADCRNKLDAEFHIGIALATGNPVLVKLIGDLRSGLEDESLTVSVVADRRARARIEHRAILDAIAARDPDSAAQAMQVHLDAIDRSLATLRRKGLRLRSSSGIVLNCVPRGNRTGRRNVEAD
jgi:DNA-binding FadR family transcriptional regulator